MKKKERQTANNKQTINLQWFSVFKSKWFLSTCQMHECIIKKTYISFLPQFQVGGLI